MGSPAPLTRDVPRATAVPAADPTLAGPELSVVLPCLNEAATLGACIETIQATLRQHHIAGEVIVADNGSNDGSSAIAASLCARVVQVKERGYGNALMGGVAAAWGKYVVMGDCDGTYDFRHLPQFLDKLRQGYELVMGNRFRGGIAPGAMPKLHRYLGNPVLSFLGRVFFRAPCGDFHCGLRGFTKSGYEKLGMRCTGMEFASEMVVKAALTGLRVTEIPTTLSAGHRDRQPYLRTWRDGWRHLRFMLLYSPRWLFLYPGLALIVAGLGVGAWLMPQPRTIGGITFDVHTLLYAMVAILIGFQAVGLAVFSHVFASYAGFKPGNPRLQRLSRGLTLEIGLGIGLALVLGGIAGSIYAVHLWGRLHFGPLNTSQTLRTVVPAVTALTMGCQVTLFSFFLSVLGLARKS